jgi:hypothetical protein
VSPDGRPHSRACGISCRGHGSACSPDCPTCQGRDGEPATPAVKYDRDVLVNVIIYHGRTSIKGCHCGWAELGRSHAEHVADVYEQSVQARGE